MARKKLTRSRVVEKADMRMNGSKSIDPDLNLGGDLKMATFTAKLSAQDAEIAEYNQMLSALDQKKNSIGAGDKAISVYSERWLKAVGVQYGFDSDEYEMAGGTRKSERKKSKKKAGDGDDTPTS